MLVALRQRHPRWGATKLLAVAARHAPAADWPSRSTVCTQLKKRGLVRPRRRRHAPGPGLKPRGPITAVNEVWTTDFKGEFRTGNGAYCYPLTLRDGFSRFVLRCDALRGPTYDATRRQFERAFGEYGLPHRIRSDNGTPFAGAGVARLSRLAVWWIRLGIVPERIALGHPEQNGSHEQFHSVLKAETTRPPATTARGQQRRFDRFCAEYNYERPHAALANHTPAMVYQPSPRPLPRALPPIEYAGHLGDPPRLRQRVPLVGRPDPLPEQCLDRRGCGLRRSRGRPVDGVFRDHSPGALRRTASPTSPDGLVHGGALRQLRWLRA